jgi:glycine betaine/proline transport system ATP-binding protein
MEVGNTEPCEQAVSMDARCEDVLPLFADHKWVGVVDETGQQIGRVTARQVITALARYTPQRESEAA